MEYQEFVPKVREYTQLDRANAEQAIMATLETLSGRLSRVHRRHMAAQLPDELKSLFLKSAKTERFLPEEFYNRVAARSGVRFHDAFKNARAVIRTLNEAMAPGELDDILSEIPDEYNELFGRQPSGIISATTVDTHQLYSKLP